MPKKVQIAIMFAAEMVLGVCITGNTFVSEWEKLGRISFSTHKTHTLLEIQLIFDFRTMKPLSYDFAPLDCSTTVKHDILACMKF